MTSRSTGHRTVRVWEGASILGIFTTTNLGFDNKTRLNIIRQHRYLWPANFVSGSHVNIIIN